MSKIKQLTGKTFYDLRVVKFLRIENRKAIWLCKCICGNITEMATSSLTSGNTKSCGCRKLRVSLPNLELGNAKISLINQRFGSWYVLSDYKSDKNGQARWLCRCEDCSIEKPVLASNLTRLLSSGCGCKNASFSKGLRHSYASTIYHSYKAAALKRNRVFSLTKTDFYQLIEQSCSYCGHCPIPQEKLYCGIDRINNNIGYVLKNCVPCCSTCNYMKRDMTSEEFTEHINRVYIHLSRRN